MRRFLYDKMRYDYTLISPFYTGESDLYKDSAISEYYLFLRHKDYSREEFKS